MRLWYLNDTYTYPPAFDQATEESFEEYVSISIDIPENFKRTSTARSTNPR